jgi:hypothetical protein
VRNACYGGGFQVQKRTNHPVLIPEQSAAIDERTQGGARTYKHRAISHCSFPQASNRSNTSQPSLA